MAGSRHPQYFPPCSHVNILITTRDPELSVHAPNASFRIIDLEEDEAVNLLLTMVVDNNITAGVVRDQAIAVVNELGHLPLAIVQAGAYIVRTRNLHGYLGLYGKNRIRLWKAQPVQIRDDYR